MGKRKEFDPELFAENDQSARGIVKSYFRHHGLCVEDNDDQYGIDLLITFKGEVMAGVEVERRHNWDGDFFPFPTIHMPERKLKYGSYDFPTFYCTTNESMTYGFIIPFFKIKNCPIRKQENKYVADEEYFINIPLNGVEMVSFFEEGEA